MVEQKKTKRERDIKSKLMAAIAMLLVSSIMMVSTTYAWFTLSTAPEVTGITTAVGANGNLEMALMPSVKTAANGDLAAEYYTTASEALAAIHSASGDSFAATKDWTETNITWGNLVDLSHNSYHMSDIVLYPSTANISEAGVLLQDALLNIPVYGSDGRVSTLTTVKMNGTYTDGGFFENTGFGVRAVGKSSNMSARQLAYESAKSAGNVAASNAAGAASKSLNIGGNTLASMAMKRAQSDSAKFSDAELLPLYKTYQDLLNPDTGAITYLEKAVKQYIIAAAIAKSSDAAYAELKTQLENSDLYSISTEALGEAAAIITKLSSLKGAIQDASDDLEDLIGEGTDTTEEHEWDTVYDLVSLLGDTNGMLLNGQTLKHYTDNNFANATELVDAVMSGKGLKLAIFSGIYTDIADFTGNYSAPATINITYAGFTDYPVPVTMDIAPHSGDGYEGVPYLNTIKAAVPNYQKAEGDNAKNPISDFYGYIVDLAFRTNASDSKLQLQTEAANRIYEGETANTDVIGGGSTMSFDIDSTSSNNPDTVKSLMGSIRLVFFDPMTGAVKGYGRLDVENVRSEVTEGAEDTTSTKLIADVKLTNGDSNVWKTNETTTAVDESVVLMDLQQNTATALSVLVYLDGASITNASVSTDNLRGSLNLQFSSSADLEPMKYNDLQTGASTPADETP